jgi:cation diffusion facilitator family transporter
VQRRVIRIAGNKRKIRDVAVKKSLKWHILRLLRLQGRDRRNLTEALGAMYLGYWEVNGSLVDTTVHGLVDEGLVRGTGTMEITDEGLEALRTEDRRIDEHLERGFSKEACARYSLWGNVILSALEFLVGFLSGSIGLLADAVHTAIDIVASALTWIGIRVDREAEAALLGGIILCGIGAFIAYESFDKILEPTSLSFQAVAIVTIFINIAVNGFFSYYKFYVGGKTRSISLIADAYHTKTDVWSSVAVLVGLLGATVGFLALDAIAGAVVSVFIVLGGYELIQESRKVMRGEDPRIEKYSRFLEGHLRVLPERGAFVSLWFYNIAPTSEEENRVRLQRSLGRHYPIGLEDRDYDAVYEKIKGEDLVEAGDGIFRITEKGKTALHELAEQPAAVFPVTGRRFLNPRLIDTYAGGL